MSNVSEWGSETPPLSLLQLGVGRWGEKVARALAGPLNLSGSLDLYDPVRSVDRIEGLEFLPRMPHLSNYSHVFVISHQQLHFELCRQALLAGCHVFVEKPMCESFAEAMTLAELARRRRRVLRTGHIFLHTREVRSLTWVVRRGRLGRVEHIISQRLSPGPVREGSLVFDHFPHDVSILIHLLRVVPSSILARGRCSSQHNGYEVVTALLQYENGVFASLTNGWRHPTKVRSISISLESGSILYDLCRPRKLEIFDKCWRSLYSSKPTDYCEPLVREIRDFLRDTKTIRDKDRLQEDLDAMRVLDAIQQSLLSGREVFLEP